MTWANRKLLHGPLQKEFGDMVSVWLEAVNKGMFLEKSGDP